MEEDIDFSEVCFCYFIFKKGNDMVCEYEYGKGVVEMEKLVL